MTIDFTLRTAILKADHFYSNLNFVIGRKKKTGYPSYTLLMCVCMLSHCNYDT